MKSALIIALMLLATSVQAIPMLEDKRPSNVSADAQIQTTADEVDVPTQPQVSTNVTIERIIPYKVSSGDLFTVTLKVTNHHTQALNLLIVDPQRQGIAYVGGPQPYMVQYDGLQIPLFRWQENLAPGQVREYSYQVRAGSPGSITFPPASVNDDYGNAFETHAAFVKVECKPTGKCDGGKNYVNCPQDCPTGSQDDVCDAADDSRIDPDCTPGADPDSAITSTTLPDKIPIAQPQGNGCIPMLLAPAAMIAAAIAWAGKMAY